MLKKRKIISSTEAGYERRFRDIELLGDKEGQMVTNYQEVSEHLVKRIFETMGEVEILEVCCGIGSLTVFLAKTFSKIIALDINPIRVKATSLNLKRQETNNVDLLVADAKDKKVFEDIKNKNNIGVILTDVTWSETGIYEQDHTGDLNKTTPASDKLFRDLNDLGWKNICMRLPKTISYDQLKRLGPVEIEEISINEDLKFVYAYLGKLIKKIGITRKDFKIERN